ncbi:class I SAM-dependent methyltransferase [Rhodoferax sp. GW822-FHT02A01]|uniref:class I SAM-dependent methyltransferase n=1 Tax=Rhodoferax sp. GW822-FHT02A01 TaxID=3141537 RepID=UPI00315DDCC6
MTTASATAHNLSAPSPWITRWTHLLAAGCSVLDVACGSGRHLQWFAERGHAVWGVDKDIAAAQQNVPQAHLLQVDIETGLWPLADANGLRTFGAVVVTNYLWRPLLPTLVSSVAPGGYFLYETFAAGNETVGRPSRPDFLLQAGELLQACAGMQIVAYENGFLPSPDRFVQRIVAFAPALPDAGHLEMARHTL